MNTSAPYVREDGSVDPEDRATRSDATNVSLRDDETADPHAFMRGVVSGAVFCSIFWGILFWAIL